MNIGFMENHGQKSFSCQTKALNHVSQRGEHGCSAQSQKEWRLLWEVCLIWWINFDYKENGGEKAFLANPKHQYCASQWRENYCSANNKKNGD